jgi:hypothetical protein
MATAAMQVPLVSLTAESGERVTQAPQQAVQPPTSAPGVLEATAHSSTPRMGAVAAGVVAVPVVLTAALEVGMAAAVAAQALVEPQVL